MLNLYQDLLGLHKMRSESAAVSGVDPIEIAICTSEYQSRQLQLPLGGWAGLMTH